MDDNGLEIRREYDGNRISRYEVYNNNDPQYYYEFDYDENGRINKSQYTSMRTTNQYAPEIITYNDKGQWVKSTFTYSDNEVVTQAVEYDDKGQLQKITSSTNKAGTTTVNFTATYTWENGNNVYRTYTSPNLYYTVEYEFDLSLKNKLKKAQEKLPFFSLGVAYNKNLFTRATLTNTTNATTTKTETVYAYELDETGYPYQVTRTTTTANGTQPPINSIYEYDCD